MSNVCFVVEIYDILVEICSIFAVLCVSLNLCINLLFKHKIKVLFKSLLVRILYSIAITENHLIHFFVLLLLLYGIYNQIMTDKYILKFKSLSFYFNEQMKQSE